MNYEEARTKQLADAEEWLQRLEDMYINNSEAYTVEQVHFQLREFMLHIIDACEMAKRHAEE